MRGETDFNIPVSLYISLNIPVPFHFFKYPYFSSSISLNIPVSLYLTLYLNIPVIPSYPCFSLYISKYLPVPFHLIKYVTRQERT